MTAGIKNYIEIDIDKLLPKDKKYDLIFSCPPYYDLEKYSEDKSDLSNLSWSDFKKDYEGIINKSCERLKNDSFAVFVISDIRDKKGFYRGLSELTIKLFEKNKCFKYNEAILLNNLSTMPMRASKQFTPKRKLGRVHQDVLIFFKGDINNIKPYNKAINNNDEPNEER